MDADSKERLQLVFKIRDTLRQDFNARNGSRYSESEFQKEVEKAYPRVETTNLLSTARLYTKALEKDPNLNWGFNHDKLEGLLNYIFVNRGSENWPRTERIVKTFADGKYAEMIQRKPVEHIPLTEEERVRAGATPGEPEHIQLLELYKISTKRNSEKIDVKMGKIEEELKRIKEEGNQLRIALSETIKALELKEDSLTKEEKEQLKSLKEIISK